MLDKKAEAYIKPLVHTDILGNSQLFLYTHGPQSECVQVVSYVSGNEFVQHIKDRSEFCRLQERTMGNNSDKAPSNQVCDLQQLILEAATSVSFFKNNTLYLNSKY